MSDVVEKANWGRSSTRSSMFISLAAERRAHLKIGVAALVWETTTILTTKWQKGHGTLTLMASLGSEETTFLLMMRYNVNIFIFGAFSATLASKEKHDRTIFFLSPN